MANVPFDPVIYKLIKANYTHNIAVFSGLAPGQKIGFDGNTGKFSVQTNRERGNLSTDSKQSARDADTFVFPITALMYEACRNNIKPRLLDQVDPTKPYKSRPAHEFLDDLRRVETALGTLLATYSDRWQFFKGDQKNNIRTLQDTANKFKAIAVSSENWEMRYSKLNYEFAEATNFKSSPGVYNIIVSALNDRSIINFLDSHHMHNVDELIMNYELMHNLEYFYVVKKLSMLLYNQFYSGGKRYNADAIMFIEYLQGLQRSAPNARIDFQHNQTIVFEHNRFKEVINMEVTKRNGRNLTSKEILNVSDQNLVYENKKHSFIWFIFGTDNRQSMCRVYLNVKLGAQNHHTVIREIYNLKLGVASNLIKYFKTVTYLDSRPDAVCIYCYDLAGARNVAKLLSEKQTITSLLNRSVANTQKQLYPGIGIGEEPDTSIMGAEYADRYIETEGKYEKIQKKVFNPTFSYGTHRCFLIAWAIIRMLKINYKKGYNYRSREFLQGCIIETQLIFEENGLDFTKPHKESTLHQENKILMQQLWATSAAFYQAELEEAKRIRVKMKNQRNN